MRKQSTLYRSGLIINEVNFNLNCTFYCIFVSCSEPKKCPCVLECIIAAISTLFLLNSLSINLLFDSRGNIFFLFEVP